MKKGPVIGVGLLAVLLLLLFLLGGGDGSEPSSPPPPAPSLDECRVIGAVVTADGRPLPGVAVRARILEPGVAHAASPVRTDQGGRFTLRLFPPRGDWEIRAQPEGRPSFAAPVPIRAEPGTRLEVRLREMATGETASADAEEEPNIAGEVVDGIGRLLTGIPVIAVDPAGNVIARTESGEEGLFAMRIEADPPFCVRMEPEDSREPLYDPDERVDRLPCLDLWLIRSLGAPRREVLYIRADPRVWRGNQTVRIRLYNSVGEVDLDVHRQLVTSPWRFEHIPLGVYDVRVDGEGVAGALQGLDFRPGNDLAVVALDEESRIRARLTRPARAFLISKSPTLVPVSRSFREDDGANARVRGVWWRTKDKTATAKLDIAGLPAGEFLLVLFGEGIETVRIPIVLAGGEVEDLGAIEIEPATGATVFTVVDQDGGGLEFGYLLRIYSPSGNLRRVVVGPGPDREVRFSGLEDGAWMYRVERLLSGLGHRRSVGWDRPFEVRADRTTRVEVDCTWRME